jgi:hypothetical protein
MGWDGGSSVAESFARNLLRQERDTHKRRVAYRSLLVSLANQDWNDQPDVIGIDPILDEVIYETETDRFGLEIYGRDMSHVQPAKWHYGRYYFPDDPEYDSVHDGSGAVEQHNERKSAAQLS